MTTFTGFPPELFTFYEGLERNNSKEYWTGHKSIWENQVRNPMRALLADIEDEFGPMRMFRPNRDVRFSKDKSPYKLWVGATSESQAQGGIGYYVEASAKGITIGYGAMLMDRDQLTRYRDAIIDEKLGSEFEDICKLLDSAGLPISCGAEPPLKRDPRGYPIAHPRSEYLRWKGAAIVREFARAAWMHTPDARDHICEVWRACRPLKAWLEANVGRHEPR